MKKIETAVLLCGGKGTRLRPVTYEIPKSLVPIQGKTLLEHLLDLLKKYGIKNVILSVGYLKDNIKQHFGDGSRFGINITYVEEDTPLGTAGPLGLLKTLNMLPNRAFITSNGDELKDINITEMYKLHKAKNALATIALTRVEDPSQYGVARLEGNRILEFVEKPKKGEAPSNLINSGFYILEPSIVDIVHNGFAMLEKDVFPLLARQGKLFGFSFKGQWFDIGNPERLEKARREWKGI